MVNLLFLLPQLPLPLPSPFSLDINHSFTVDFELMACWDVDVDSSTDSAWPVAKKVGNNIKSILFTYSSTLL
jgi:hypothetical protein